MSDPVNVALYGHRTQLWLENASTGSKIVVPRVQSVEPSFNFPLTKYYELGRKGPIGATQSPPEFRITFEQNLINTLRAEYVLTGKDINPAGGQSYNLGDILTYASRIRAYVLNRNNDDTLMNEQVFDGLSVSEIQYRFTVGQAIMQSFTLIGASGSLLTGAAIQHAWGTLDDTSLGAVDGKDARIWFASGSTPASREFRLQSFTIRATFPNVYVRELGRRALVGTLSDAPDVSIDFDILLADSQPSEDFFTLASNTYDYQNPLSLTNAFVRVFDPTAAEGVLVVKSFKLENLRLRQHTPIRAQVRGLATARYTMEVVQETTTDSGGLVISNINQ